MPHPNKAKGNRWEAWCSKFLGIKRSRLRNGVHADEGDLDDPDFTYECKDDASRSPMQWWKQALEAQARSGRPWAVVLAKVRNPRQGEPRGWAQMSIEQWRGFSKYVRDLESALDAATGSRTLRDIILHDARCVADNPLPFPQRPSPERPAKPGQRDFLVSGGRDQG